MTIQNLSSLVVVLLLWVIAWHRRSAKGRQILLLVASYVFYASWGIGFLCVLIVSSLVNYACGCFLRRRASLGYLSIGIALNLLLLGFFKYLPPLGASWLDSWHADFLRQILIPVGISFWTFQGLSYLIDLYREEELDPSPLEFFLYMAFWPTVLSGPVCRLAKMLPQFRQVAIFTRDDLSIGGRRLLLGLFMKFVLAQLLGSGLRSGEGIIAGFDQVKESWGALDVWLLAIGFGFQLFFDFAGYSHMVIGTSRLFGIRLEENFDRPFFSSTPSVFWTRWHMSLSFWIRDYVFLPLAALRHDRWWPYMALVLTMAVFGLWHAAKATFILWGIYHGLLLVMHRLGQKVNRRLPFTLPPHLGALLSWAGTFAVVSLGWILFRAHDLDQALTMFRSVFSPGHYGQLTMPRGFYLITSFVVIGYFLWGVIASLSARWKTHYKEELRTRIQVIMRREPLKSFASLTVMVQLVRFFGDRLWWWSTPIIVGLTFFIGLVIFDQNFPIATTPFMYTLF